MLHLDKKNYVNEPDSFNMIILLFLLDWLKVVFFLNQVLHLADIGYRVFKLELLYFICVSVKADI